MNVDRELNTPDDRDARTVGRLAAAYTLLQMASYTRDLDFSPGDTAAYIVKQAKQEGKLGRLWRVVNL